MLQELLTDNPESVRWPDALRAARRHPRLRPRGARGARPGPRAGARPGRPASRSGGDERRARSSRPPGCFLRAVPRRPRRPERHRLPRPDRPRGDRGRGRTATSCAPGSRHVFVDEYQDTDPSQVAPAPGARRRRPRPDRGRRPRPVDLRLPRRRRARHPRLPARRSRTADGAPGAGGRARHHPPLRARGCCAPRGRSPPAIAVDRRRSRRAVRRASARPSRPPTSSAPARVEVLTFDTARAETEHVADLLRRAHLEDGVAWSRDGGAGPLGPRLDPGAAPGAGRRRRARRGGQRRDAAGARARGAAAARRARAWWSTSTSTTRPTTTSSAPTGPRRC